MLTSSGLELCLGVLSLLRLSQRCVLCWHNVAIGGWLHAGGRGTCTACMPCNQGTPMCACTPMVSHSSSAEHSCCAMHTEDV